MQWSKMLTNDVCNTLSDNNVEAFPKLYVLLYSVDTILLVESVTGYQLALDEY